MTALDAVGDARGTLSQNVWNVFEYLRDIFPSARVMDPANANTVISDDRTVAEKSGVHAAAVRALAAQNWTHHRRDGVDWRYAVRTVQPTGRTLHQPSVDGAQHAIYGQDLDPGNQAPATS
jgi:hypothetical protein